ncbi:MAG: RHS repeat-associated core domain-containing protein, partial [Candidatus Sulfotelmatobacter sp.]
MWAQTFSYDPFGNITKSGSVSWLPGYNTATNHYSLGGTSYDAYGNVLKDSFNTYTWDAEGKLLSTAYGGGETTGFTYDAFGHMAERSINGAYSHSYLTLGKFKFSATGQTAGYSETPLPGGSVLSQNGGATGVQLADWLGTIRAFVSYTGGTEGSSGAHAPFGEAYAYDRGYPLGFTGEGFDDANSPSTTYWFPERQYSSGQGRWLSPDPAGLAAVDQSNPQSWNRYAYVLNNPLSNVDPTGLYCEYFGESDESDEGASFDFHSDKGTCEGNGPEGGGKWFDDPSTTVTVNGITGDVDTISTFTGNEGLTPLVTVQRSFDRNFPCTHGASSVIGNLESNFPAAADWQKGPLHVTFLQRGPLAPGTIIPIDGPVGQGHWFSGMLPNMALTSAVSVQSVGSSSFTFATVPGMHPFDNGTVSFSASDVGSGNIDFSVDVNAAFSSKFAGIAFNLG